MGNRSQSCGSCGELGMAAYHLKEQASRYAHVRRQRRLHDRDVDGDDSADHRSSADASDDLSREQDETTHRRQRSSDHQAERDGRVE
jgi:hypothetical protein